MNKFLIFLSCFIFTTARAEEKSLTYDELVSSALSDVKKLQNDLSSAKKQITTARSALSNTKEELILTETKVTELQTKIDEQTLVIEQVKNALDIQSKETNKWKIKYDDVYDKLWFWRRIVIVIVVLALLYLSVKALKAYGKLTRFGL